MEMASDSALLVGAIDFGTSFSGWAFSFKHENEKSPPGANVRAWNAGTIVTEKTPTCILLKPNGTFDSFGYDAEERYADLSNQRKHGEYYFFRHFKMKLFEKFGQGINRNMMIRDEIGKTFLALDIFAMSLKFLVDDMMQIVNQRVTCELSSADIKWVLTVPAIWSDASKQFMREAALKAGMDTKRLRIALEPEAASIFCRQLPVDTSANETKLSLSSLPVGTKYMVLDAGGGTIDITVHEIQESNTLREVKAANGGDWGGMMVNKAFEDFLRELVGDIAFEAFRTKHTEDWLFLSLQFEAKKREIKITSSRYITMRFPFSLCELCEKNMQIQDAIDTTRYAEIVQVVRDKIRLSKVIFFYMFGHSIYRTVDHVKALFKDKNMQGVNTILMVGGFSESPLLQQALQETLPDISIVVPSNPSSCVLRGALMYGHSPSVMSERVLKYTYGVECLKDFEEGQHPEVKKKNTDRGLRCKDIFSVLVRKDTVVNINEAKFKHNYFTVYKNQRRMTFNCFISEKTHPMYVDEEGCSKIGKLVIDFDDPVDHVDRNVSCSFAFGGTEIIVEIEDQMTGNKARAVLDFLG